MCLLGSAHSISFNGSGGHTESIHVLQYYDEEAEVNDWCLYYHLEYGIFNYGNET